MRTCVRPALRATDALGLLPSSQWMTNSPSPSRNAASHTAITPRVAKPLLVLSVHPVADLAAPGRPEAQADLAYWLALALDRIEERRLVQELVGHVPDERRDCSPDPSSRPEASRRMLPRDRSSMSATVAGRCPPRAATARDRRR